MQPDAPLMAAGLDSLGATELSQSLSVDLNTELPATVMFDYPSLASVSEYL